jgi:5'-3' exonuclease
MGITGFNAHITKTYPTAYKQQANIKKCMFFDHIYIDLNYLLHICSYKATNQKQIISKVEYHIKLICSNYIPTKSLNLCSDGVAPFAKLFVQRERRLGEIRNSDITSLSTSSLNFTPGSIFMMTLHEKFAKLINSIKLAYSVKVNIFNLDPGEAEIKIKKLIEMNNIIDSKSNHLVVSNDADQILIQCSTLFYKNIYILIESKEPVILSIGKLITLHQEKYGISKFSSFDFAFLNLLNGNDYFPKIKYSTIDKLWNAYKFTIKTYGELVSEIEPFQINLKCLSKIISRVIAQTSSKLISNATLQDYNYDAYNSYLDGLMWCSQMYMTGNCEDYSYIYDSNINPEPLLFLMHINKQNLHYGVYKSMKPVSNELCVLLLMPLSAKSLCDEHLHKFMTDNLSLYEEEQCMNCREFHSEISSLNKAYAKSLNKDTEIRKKITSCSKLYHLHKQSHMKINEKFINEVQTKLDVYLKSNNTCNTTNTL